jgi:hypothetical protein
VIPGTTIFRRLLSLFLAVLCSATTALAGSATWLPNPGSSSWNTATNWTPATIPNGSNDTATFSKSAQTAVAPTVSTTVKTIVFSAGADAFAISVNPSVVLTISGVGVTNSSGINQTLLVTVDANDHAGRISFTNAASAGNSTISISGSGTFDGTLASDGYAGISK